jgi:hypothetical protein
MGKMTTASRLITNTRKKDRTGGTEVTETGKRESVGQRGALGCVQKDERVYHLLNMGQAK